MAPEPSASPTVESPETGERSSTAINALIGAVTGIVLTFVPLSTFLGGAVAGYLEGGEPEDGLKVGALAGLIMFLPFILIGLFFATVLLGIGTGGPPLVFGMILFFILTTIAAYTVALSAVGGLVGVYLEHEL